MKINHTLTTILLFTAFYNLQGQQSPDTSFEYSINKAAYLQNQGPTILIDEAHHNFHTKDGGYFALNRLLEHDGYNIGSIKEKFSNSKVFGNAEIIIIANALHPSNIGNWVLPTPSAFSENEISNINDWVKNGGKLVLIADHMPFAGAANDLAKSFGFEFLNGFAKTASNFWPPSNFDFENERLSKSPIVSGIGENNQVTSVTSFTGSAFKIPKNAIPILQFTKTDSSLQPDTAWRFTDETQTVSLENYYQGATLNYGKGKVVVFGEAAMFTAQITRDGLKVGFNSTFAPQNVQFILNLFHYIDNISELKGTEVLLKSRMQPDEIIKQNQVLTEAFLNNDFSTVAAAYADDARMIGNKHEIIGRIAIDDYWSKLKDRGINWELINLNIEVFDEVAIQRGISKMRFLYDGKEQESEVKFTLIWKKINDEWKIYIDHYSLL